ncbi:MAG: phosphatidate cytidylyltransferase [Lachnospiraceae bacterium]|nr:phosphatidate cytidylyltransferase [Lachnospiraceae bacterium]
MKTRIISGVCIGFVIVPVLLLGGWVLWGFLLAISLIAFFELTGATGVRKKGMILTAPELAGAIAIVALYLALKFVGALSCYVVIMMLLLTTLFFIYVLSFPRIHSRELIAAFFCVLYAPCMLSFLWLLWTLPNGNYAVWLPFVAWISDTFAYFTGRFLGKHKLTPILSPKKTVEGAAGGVVGSLLAGLIYGAIVGHHMGDYQLILVFVIITPIGSVIAQLGDLVASGIKRDHGIKDFGKCIPGHGGIMDRFDSVILITPMIYFLYVFLLQVMAK